MKKLDVNDMEMVTGGANAGQTASMTVEEAKKIVSKFTGSPAGSMQELFVLLDSVNMVLGRNPSSEKRAEFERVRDAVMVLLNAPG